MREMNELQTHRNEILRTPLHRTVQFYTPRPIRSQMNANPDTPGMPPIMTPKVKKTLKGIPPPPPLKKKKAPGIDNLTSDVTGEEKSVNRIKKNSIRF